MTPQMPRQLKMMGSHRSDSTAKSLAVLFMRLLHEQFKEGQRCRALPRLTQRD
jgi:hypothetical protein